MTLFADTECPRCGCTGLHACIGHKPKPTTKEEQKRLKKALDELFRRIEQGKDIGLS